MTPHPPSEHPELDALADLAEDLLPSEQAEPLHRHLAACPACAEDYAALCGLPELLADVPAPPMPQEVADRLTAALAAESAARAQTRAEDPPKPAAAPSGPTAPLRTDAPAGAPRAATGPGRPARPRRRRRTAGLLLGTAAVALAATLGGLLIARNQPTGSFPTATGDSAVDAASGGSSHPHPNAAGGQLPEFTADRLPAQIRELLAAKPAAGLSPADPGSDTPTCMLAAAGHPADPPLTTGPGTYRGRPVLALVFRPPGGSGPLDVYLATPDCPGSTILLHSTVPAP
ncbi:anti-sigma factor family protein [Kitasatospora sp. CB01950]|uniref:anti-sigma factor family protein n=1 Tax=Kitasatospora sp. CB01950 TaxID=1703930 RepID=UPI00093D8B23|nr:hypothetical protein [Kitasatospora sp. CB01950]